MGNQNGGLVALQSLAEAQVHRLAKAYPSLLQVQWIDAAACSLRDWTWRSTIQRHPAIAGRKWRGATVLDIGANTGQFARVMANLGANVWSFEPNPTPFRHLERLARRVPAIRASNQAVTADGREVSLFVPPTSPQSVYWSMSGTTTSGKFNADLPTLQAGSVSLRSLLEQHSRIDLLKIDIEGGEYELIPEILPALERIDAVLIEEHAHKMQNGELLRTEALSLLSTSRHKDRVHLDWH